MQSPSKGGSASITSGLVLGLLCYALFIVGVGWGPYLWPPSGSVASAASVEGYNTNLAHLLAVLISIVTVGIFAIWSRGSRNDANGIQKASTLTIPWKRQHFVEAAVIAIVVSIVYWPSILSRGGPYIEDSYFLTALHRMAGGLQPFKDFEFVYGPLMLYLSYFGVALWGYSMQAYFTVLCAAEVAVFLLLYVIVRVHFPRLRDRLTVFIVGAILLCNTLMGFNWNGLRRLLPIVAILLVTGNPSRMGVVIGGAVIAGIELAYSQDLGMATVITVGAIYAFLALWEKRLSHAIRGLCFAVVAAAVGAAIITAVLGDRVPTYLLANWQLVNRFSAGETGFRFYWTANSLAAFGLLCLACILVGWGVAKRERVQPISGDLLLLGGFVYTLIVLRSGLNRADMWHIGSAVLCLVFAFTLPRPRAVFSDAAPVQKLAGALVFVLVCTYAVALLPSLSFVAQGWVAGLSDSIRRPVLPSAGVVTRAPNVELERAHPDAELLRAGAYLAESDKRNKPVFFYGEAWGLDKRLGVYKTAYVTDDVLLSDDAGLSTRNQLEHQPDTLVVIDREAYTRLFGIDRTNALTETAWYGDTRIKIIAGWLSTVHFAAAPVERRARENRWERTIGSYLRTHYQNVAEFGDIVVLERSAG